MSSIFFFLWYCSCVIFIRDWQCSRWFINSRNTADHMNTKCSSGPSVRATCPSNPVHFCYRFSIPTHKLNKPSKMHDEKTHVLNISPHTIHTTNVRCTCPSMCSTYKHVRSTIFLTEKRWKSTGREWGAWMHLRMFPVVNPTVPTMFRLDVSEMHATTMPAAGWRRSNSHPISKSGFLKDSTVIWHRNFCHMSSPYVHVFSTAPYNKRFFNSRCVIYWRAQSLRWHVLNSDRHTPECLSPDAEYNKTIKACSSACSLISNSHVTCPFINKYLMSFKLLAMTHVVSNTLNSLF